MEAVCLVISVDCKKKELIGNYKKNGQGCEVKQFVIIRKTNEKIDKQIIEAFSKSCFEYSLKNLRLSKRTSSWCWFYCNISR